MDVYGEKYLKIVNELIERSFPELMGGKIFIFETKSEKFNAMAVEFLSLKFIFVSKKSRRYSNSALKGLFAHELSHFSIIERMTLFENFFYFSRLLFSKKIKADFERKSDRLVIEKGLAKNLVILKKEGEKGKTKIELKKKYKKGYLSQNETKSYAKKIGKW